MVCNATRLGEEGIGLDNMAACLVKQVKLGLDKSLKSLGSPRTYIAC
jgi:hypothetical protein